MNQYATMIRNLKSPEVMERLMHLYGRRDGMLVEQTGRYIGLLKRHEELFHENREVLMISAPGRTEIGGNHTDHNRGRVLAAAINLDTLSAVSARDDMMVEIHSDGYPAIKVDLGSLDVVEKEKGKTHALVRGVAARMAELGYKIGGFNAAGAADGLAGSGVGARSRRRTGADVQNVLISHTLAPGHGAVYTTFAPKAKKRFNATNFAYCTRMWYNNQ